MNIHIRSATVSDIPAIIPLIVESFYAMADLFGDDGREFMASQMSRAIGKDLESDSFQTTYFNSENTHFWVAVNSDDEIVGTVGVKVKDSTSFGKTIENGQEDLVYELVRMSAAPSVRGQGIGTKLMKEVDTFCRNRGIGSIFIGTANPRSKDFYIKNGAVITSSSEFSPRPGITVIGYELTISF